MTQEFENLLELLKNTDKGTFFLGLQVAQNYKEEFLDYFGFSVEKVEKMAKKAVKETDFYLFIKKLNITFDDYCQALDFFTPGLPDENQCTSYVELKSLVLAKKTPKIEDLLFLHQNLRQYFVNNWRFIAYLKFPKE